MKTGTSKAKFYAACCGIVATMVTTGFAHSPWAAGISSFLTAVAVYLVPNTTPKDN